MARVFIGGSRQVTGLEAQVCDRRDRIVAKDLSVLVGDAGGADEAVQRCFRGRGFGNATVFSADLPGLLAGLERQTASRLWAAAAAEGLGEAFADLEGLRF
jgi:hypothetical protein